MSNLKNGPENGSMATNMEEVKLLGKQMEKLRDQNELKKDHRAADPAQFEGAPTVKQREND
ncbi:hypothetical protein [Psychrobacillus vulpis]|uniref:Multidrug ABC transporter ATPase n=1 Tax=Psychrobacillus vulpis TaxID=2325572 RepID=A0A544TNP4_9BACI|nr:hypothetical protein [Psychrobacillus vulpis]TQR19078.1 multidrug ABC transporter ATPase [Psychrobacillus vulpis]